MRSGSVSVKNRSPAPGFIELGIGLVRGFDHAELSGTNLFHDGSLCRGGDLVDGCLLFDYQQRTFRVHLKIAMLSVEQSFHFVLRDAFFDFLADAGHLSALQVFLNGFPHRRRKIFHLQLFIGGPSHLSKRPAALHKLTLVCGGTPRATTET